MMFDIGMVKIIVFFTASLNLKLFSEELLLFITTDSFKLNFFLFLFNVKEITSFYLPYRLYSSTCGDKDGSDK